MSFIVIMPSNVKILHINSASDGTGALPQNTQSMVRNDTYFMQKIAERWAKDRQEIVHPGLIYQLDRLPAGYAGFEKTRDSKTHVDRYLYGHPRGQFRSLNELYPHFKHLQDFATPAGCPCKLCSGPRQKRSSDIGSSGAASDGSPTRPRPSKSITGKKSSYFSKVKPSALLGAGNLPQGRPLSNLPAPKKKQVDELGTPDVYRNLLDKLKSAGTDGKIHEDIVDQMSPDWRAGHEALMELLDELQALPRYVPRIGELVLFARTVSSDELLCWDGTTQTLRRVDRSSNIWLDRPKWEVGVVTQMPVEAISIDDLSSVSERKKQNVTYSGFRVEPLSEPSSQNKSLTKQHKYIPLHATRPFLFWKECTAHIEEKDWHPTIQHALTVASSFCIIGKYSFKGTWPEATIFVRSVYLGAELIMVGDTVRLTPRPGDRQENVVTDVMVITSIRLRFVNLEDANDDDYDQGRPYNTCLHISGRTFTLDPKGSFDGTDMPVKPGETTSLPKELEGYGKWYHGLNPNNTRLRLEVPYTRVLGRCFEPTAYQTWFARPKELSTPPPPSVFSAVNTNSAATPTPSNATNIIDISQGLLGLQESRAYSQQHDPRIDRKAGKSWFWADSRIEQLDLHEVSGRFVGVKDELRTKTQMDEWRQALKVLDGKQGGLEAYQAARKQREEEQERRESVIMTASPYGLITRSVRPHHVPESGTEAEKGEEEEQEEEDGDSGGMEVDDEEQNSTAIQPLTLSVGDDGTTDDEDQDDEMAE